VTLETVNSLAPILTAAIIGATAIAAMIQLRHMRAANLISALWSVHQAMNDPAYRQARRALRDHLTRLMADAAFRDYVTQRILGRPAADVPEPYVATAEAATTIGNTFETLGNMIITGLIDREIFMRNYAWIIDGEWGRLEPYILHVRKAERGDGLYEDFEYLTVTAREWIKQNPVSYPKGAPRILPSFKDHAV
jgi:uncharacterized protein DUF4760